MTDAQPTVHQAMAAVMRSIGGVGKDDWNDHQKFKFRGIDALHNATYGPMCEHGVFVAPEVLDAHYADVVTSQNKPSRQATLRVRYTFYGPDGGSVSVVSQGEAMDSADKATSKAMAMAFKYALLQTFVIPTEDQDDADASTPERGQPQQQPAPEPVDLTELETVIAQAHAAGIDVDADKARAHASQSVAHRDASVKALFDRIAKLDESNGQQPEPQGAST